MDKKYMYNILVIDDETGVTKSLFRQFRRKYNVFTANSGQEAIAIMKEENIQIVISDQRMPGMTGLDFFSLIKDNYPDAIKIMLSGYSDIEAVIGAINEGQVFRYISKPWKPEELSNLLAEATEKYELITKNKRLTQTLEKCDNQLKEFLIAQKQAGAAEEKFRKIANTARVSISIMAIGLEKGILYVNEYWQKITGYTKEESLQLGALDIVHPDHRPMVAERAAKRIAGNAETDHYELKILTKSGETRWVDLTATLINYEGIPASIATALDITDRKQNQMDLIEAKEKAEQSEIKLSESLIDLHLAQKIASIGNWQFDPEIGIPVWSDEIFNIYERDKKLGPPHVDEYRKMYDKEQFEIFTTAFHTAITEGLSYGIVLKFVSPKNNEKWIHAICQPDKTRKGKKGYFLRGTIQDITKQKHTELSLIKAKEKAEESETRFQSFSEATFEAIFFSEKGVCIDQNASAEKMFGYNPEEALGRMGTEWIVPEDREMVMNNIISGFEGPYETTGLRKDGSRLPIEIKAKNSFYKGKMVRVTALADITARKKAEEALRQSEETYRILIERMPDGVYKTTHSGKVVDVNPAMVKILGFDSKEELIGVDIKKQLYFDAEERERMTQLGMENKIISYRLRKKDGTEVWVEDNGWYTYDKSGEILFHEGVIRDITERQATEKKIRELSQAVEQSPSSIVITNLKGEIEYTNPKFSEITGYLPEEALGKNPSILKSGKMSMGEYKALWKNINSGKEWRGIFYNKKKTGEFYWESASISAIKNQNGIITHYLAIKEDITEQKQTELDFIKAKEKAEESEKSYVSLFNSVIEAMYLQNEDGTFINVNDGAVRMYGYSREEFIGNTPEMVSAPNRNNIAQVSALLKRVFTTGNPETFEFWGKRKNGEIFPKEVISTRINYFGKDIILSSARDISERKQIEAELVKSKEKAEESEANITAIIEGTTNSIWAFNRNYQILYINQVMQQEFLQSFGVRLEPGMNLVHALPEALQPFWKPRYDRVLANEQYTIEDAVSTDNGTIYIQVTFNPIVKNGQVIGGSCFGSNITPRKLAEIELIAAKEKAEESDRLKSAFLANMSHEIRTPMNGILGFTNLLKEPGLSGDEQKEYIGIIEKSGDRMLNTINDIIDISRIEARQVQISLSDINLNKQMLELFEFFTPEAAKKNISIYYINNEFHPQLAIESDKDKLNSILTNLIKNAIKYTNAGTIEFGYAVKKEGEKPNVEFFVKDTGIGIPAERKKAVFERFVQADIEDKQAMQGSGLGLAISKSYVEMLGGKIWVESEEGIGSQFYFTIPYLAIQDKQPNEETQNSTENKTLKKKLKALIVDDEELIVMYLQTILSDDIEEILVAQTGLEAVEMCRNNRDIDMILMDIKMPGIDGYEATRQIREFNKDVFILAQTAFAQTGDREKTIKAGCNDYIAKPIKKDRLLEIINEKF